MSDTYTSLGIDIELRERLASECGLAAIEYHRVVDSTQRRARELAADGARDWSIVVADYQTAGRGQHGRRWSAVPGSSVMFSVIVHPEDPESMALMPIRVGLAAARALDELAGCDRATIGLKWPNDLVTESGKLGGILCEGQIRGAELRAIVGVGINVHAFEAEPGVVARPSALDAIAARTIERFDVLRAVVASMRHGLDTRSHELSVDELAEYAARDCLAGRTIDAPASGSVVGINESGYLVVRDDDGRIETVVSGSVSVIDSQS
jgi:BirA family biotin operon repressor/biotin-[acetyl-CoA-carboxylase] ligase